MNVTSKHIEELLQALGKSEYAYLYLEPMLLYGVGIGLLAYLFALLTGEKRMQSFSLVIVAISALMIGPYLGHRSAAQTRIVGIYQASHPERAEGFVNGTEIRRNQRWVYYATAGLAILTLLLGLGRSGAGFTCGGAVIVAGIFAVLVSSLAHYQESSVYHPNLKTEAKPTLRPTSGGLH